MLWLLRPNHEAASSASITRIPVSLSAQAAIQMVKETSRVSKAVSVVRQPRYSMTPTPHSAVK